jgi:hypothetical protein
MLKQVSEVFAHYEYKATKTFVFVAFFLSALLKAQFLQGGAECQKEQ